jgi:hypothetical protein
MGGIVVLVSVGENFLHLDGLHHTSGWVDLVLGGKIDMRNVVHNGDNA